MRSPRPFKNKLLPVLLLLAAHKVCAQLAPPDDFFNSGAQFYISNNVTAAKERVESGLKIYPDDAKLKKLEELLKQQQQSQGSKSQQDQQQKQQQQNLQDQKNQPQQQSQSQNSSDQKKSEQEKQNAAGQKKEEEKKQAERKKAAGEKKDEEKKDGEGQPAAPGQMTPEEAKRLLDAQKGNEQLLQLKPPDKAENATRKIKDW